MKGRAKKLCYYNDKIIKEVQVVFSKKDSDLSDKWQEKIVKDSKKNEKPNSSNKPKGKKEVDQNEEVI